eukprot:425625_1
MMNWIKGAMHNNNKDREESKRNSGILKDILGTAPLTELRNLGLRVGQRVISPSGNASGVIALLFKGPEGMKTRPGAVIALDSPQFPTQDDRSEQEDPSLLEWIDVLRECLGIDIGEISVIQGTEKLQKLEPDSLTPLETRRRSLFKAKFVCQMPHCRALVTATDAISCGMGHTFCSYHLEDTLPSGVTLQNLADAVNAVSSAGIPEAELWALAACRKGGTRSEEDALKWSLDHCISATVSLSLTPPLNCPIPMCNKNLKVCELDPVRDRLSLLQMRGRLLSYCIDNSSIGSASVLEDLDLNIEKSPSDVINPIHGGNDDVQNFFAEGKETVPIATAPATSTTCRSYLKFSPARVVHLSWDTGGWRERKCAVILPKMDWSSVLALCRRIAGLPKEAVIELYHEVEVAPTMEWDGSDPIIYQPLPKKTEVVWLNDIHNGDELVLEVLGGMHPPNIGELEQISSVPGIYKSDSMMPAVFGELQSWYDSYRRIRGDGNCYFRAIGFRALEYFMKGCDETSEERKKGFSVLIQNLHKLEFDIEQHRVEHDRLLEKLNLWQQALGWCEGEEEEASNEEQQQQKLCMSTTNRNNKNEKGEVKSSDAGLMVDHDDDDTNFACDKEPQSSSDTTSSLSFTVELEDEFFPNYKDSVPKQQKTSVASDMLAEFVNDEGGFDVAVIRACRKLVSNHLLDFADTITPGGLTYRQLIEAQQLSLEQYCTEVVDRQSEDARDFWVEMGLLPELLGVKSFLIVIDDGTNDVHIGRAPGEDGCIGAMELPIQEVQLLLYKRHYDLIYGSVEHWRGNGPKEESETFCKDLKRGLMELKDIDESQSTPNMQHLSDAIPSHLMT